ncbi:HlyD family efflux transporter periplasmic adaptor subunit [Phormidesmis sp. 146-12]
MVAFLYFSNAIRHSVKLSISISILMLCHACSTNAPNSSAENPAQAAAIESVVALGRIEPEGEVIKLSVPNAQDSRVNQILVKEGEFVRANQVIAILQGIDRREADLRDAQADVRLRIAELEKVTQGDAKKAQITAQRAAIERLEAQLKGQILRQRAAIASAEATLREARQTLDRRQSLLREGAINRADVDVARRDVATAQATLTERTAELTQTTTTLTAEINQEQAKLAELQEVRPVDVEIAQAQLEKASIAVEQQQANVRDAQVRVPIAGQILKINTRVGEQVNTTQGIVELARTDRMFAIAEISETDIAKVRSGQQATITSEYGSFAGEIKGVVEQVGLQIGKKSLQDASAVNSPVIDQNARVIAVKVRINKGDNAKVASLTNMQVKIKLEISKNANPGQTDQIPTGRDR